MNFETTAPLGIALLGLLMGMRHATDPDHVIAVTTIVSRERRLAVASRIGLVWGFGHTITVLGVGAATHPARRLVNFSPISATRQLLFDRQGG